MADISDSLQLGSDGAIQQIKDAAGIVSNARGTNVLGSLPWMVPSTIANSKFFTPISVKPERWDQLFPYRLLVVDTSKQNRVVNGFYGENSQGGISRSITQVTSSAGSAIVSFIPFNNDWAITLPISPQQLNITDQFAISTSATLRGVLEEHNGIKFKMISASGTMGVWPYRESITKPPSTPGIIQSVFGGTIEAVGNLVGQATRVVNAAATGHPANKPIAIRPEVSTAGQTSTGYYQALALQQFLEQYAESKKNPNNTGWRLVFDIPKQNQSFVVTPMQFVWQQSVTKPMEILYNIQFKAWRRIDLKEQISPVQPDVNSISPGILQRILSTISEARKLMSASIDLIGAVRSDVETPLDVLRQTALFVKDLSGVAISAADLPFQIQRDYSSSIKDSLNIAKDSINSAISDPSVRSAISAISGSSLSLEGLSQSAVAGGQLGQAAFLSQSIDPSNNVLQNPERNFSLMDQAPVASLRLNSVQQSTVDDVIDAARQTSIDDLKQFRGVILDLSLQLSNNFGAGDAFYSKVYGKPAPKVRAQPMTLDEFDILKTLYEVIESYDILTATTQIDDANKQTNMDYVAGLADQANVPFTVPNSKIMVPVPFGLTIEAIALRYLGDAQRWIEIATLNNLRDPYIDEDGFQLPLLSNATGRQITVSSQENLYLGQRVILNSITQSPSARRILGIDRLSDTSFLLTLDGEPNLDNFILSDKAYLQVYLPGTVNSQQKIFVSSDIVVPDSPNIIVPASVQSDPLVGLSKVDLLLTDSGDLAVNNYGDFRLSAGITNIIQALKIKIATQKGRFLLHPEFGLGIRPGIVNSELNVQDIYSSLNKLIQEDPRFESINSLQISIKGPTLALSMVVNLAGRNGVFPLTFELAA